MLGIDPGLVETGFGVLERCGRSVTLLHGGVIITPRIDPLEVRLEALHTEVSKLLDRFKPTLVVIEDLYSEYKFPKAAILMGHARGVICLAARQAGVPLLPLAPAEVKRAIAANGAASKGQIQRGVQMRLGLARAPRPSHVADALALALTGLSRMGTRLPR
ncbi:MAG TPA: crossover junction endodeoxyribonuclease RuvC [Methylomirabilota bacterium]|nr:crossover junction endodeoxyribonuclease RuvC [Methylomirabilota bacterium]